jgi:hypothetical protein
MADAPFERYFSAEGEFARCCWQSLIGVATGWLQNGYKAGDWGLAIGEERSFTNETEKSYTDETEKSYTDETEKTDGHGSGA